MQYGLLTEKSTRHANHGRGAADANEYDGAGRPGDPCVMVIFGASGDLTKRKLIPALYNLAKDNLLSQEFALVGVRPQTS